MRIWIKFIILFIIIDYCYYLYNYYYHHFKIEILNFFPLFCNVNLTNFNLLIINWTNFFNFLSFLIYQKKNIIIHYFLTKLIHIIY